MSSHHVGEWSSLKISSVIESVQCLSQDFRQSFNAESFYKIILFMNEGNCQVDIKNVDSKSF